MNINFAQQMQELNTVENISKFVYQCVHKDEMRYQPEKGTSHRIYFPVRETTVGTKTIQSLYNIALKVHYYRFGRRFIPAPCLKGIELKDNAGNPITSGECALCERLDDVSAICNYRADAELNALQEEVGSEEHEKKRKDIWRRVLQGSKVREAGDYLYVLIAQFKIEDKDLVIVNDKPVYDIQVMRLSAKQLESFQESCDTVTRTLAGSELVLSYKDSDNTRPRVHEAEITPLPCDMMSISNYEGLESEIIEKCEKFEFDILEKLFAEWEFTNESIIRNRLAASFKMWDDYQMQLKTNPEAKYLEYACDGEPGTMPLDVSDEPMDTSIENPMGNQTPNVNVDEAFTGLDEAEINGVIPPQDTTHKNG